MVCSLTFCNNLCYCCLLLLLLLSTKTEPVAYDLLSVNGTVHIFMTSITVLTAQICLFSLFCIQISTDL